MAGLPSGAQQAASGAGLPGVQPIPAPDNIKPPHPAELRRMRAAFADAKDCWKIDGTTMKGFYLHSQSGYLYTWDQPTGVLFEFQQNTGANNAVWSTACPQLNAELWTVLPLPPTDPASLQEAAIQSGVPTSPDVYLQLSIAHENGNQVPKEAVVEAVDAFCDKFHVGANLRRQICELPTVGQGYVMQNFKGDHAADPIKALQRYLANITSNKHPPWGSAACTLRVEATGAIVGTCCPDLAALLGEDTRLAVAHFKIKSDQDRFFVQDLKTSSEGTLLDGYEISDQLVGPLKTGSLITAGPLRMKVQLSQHAQDDPLPATASSPSNNGVVAQKRQGSRSLDGEELSELATQDWSRKVYQKTSEDRLADRQRQACYKNRAEDRRLRSGAGAHGCEGGAIDGLIGKFEKIKEEEKRLDDEEENRVEKPTMAAHREAQMDNDGTFLGGGGMERAGIGFKAEHGDEYIPNVIDPKGLTQAAAVRMKTEMRFNDLGYNARK